MKYRTLVPALLLSLGLSGSVNSGETVKPEAPAPIIKEYQGEKYEISNIKYSKFLCSNIEAEIRKKDEKSLPIIVYFSSNDIGMDVTLYLEGKKVLGISDFLNLKGMFETDGGVDMFVMGDNRYVRNVHKKSCHWEFPKDSSCEKAESLAGKVQKIFDKYDFLLGDIFEKEKAKHYLKASKAEEEKLLNKL